MSNRVVHFEIPTNDPQRAAQFYTTVFGWTFQHWEGPQDYWLVMTGEEGTPGINGGLLNRNGPLPPGMNPQSAFVCTVDVASLDDALAKAIANGATIVLPKGPVPGVGWLAYCKNPEGNIIGMMQADTSAA